MTKSFSIRDWCGIAVGVICALIPQLIFKSGDVTPLWTTILLGPPLVFLVSPKLIGVGLLVFLACALVILGLILSFRGYDSTDLATPQFRSKAF